MSRQTLLLLAVTAILLGGAVMVVSKYQAAQLEDPYNAADKCLVAAETNQFTALNLCRNAETLVLSQRSDDETKTYVYERSELANHLDTLRRLEQHVQNMERYLQSVQAAERPAPPPAKLTFLQKLLPYRDTLYTYPPRYVLPSKKPPLYPISYEIRPIAIATMWGERTLDPDMRSAFANVVQRYTMLRKRRLTLVFTETLRSFDATLDEAQRTGVIQAGQEAPLKRVLEPIAEEYMITPELEKQYTARFTRYCLLTQKYANTMNGSGWNRRLCGQLDEPAYPYPVGLMPVPKDPDSETSAQPSDAQSQGSKTN